MSCGSNDDSTNQEYVPGTFEGPEKTMEVVFRSDFGPENGLRCLTREILDKLCSLARCTILNKISNNHIDAYVLSESSMFIYKHRFIMKTCGTTTLLRCLGTLIEQADKLGMVLCWVGYSRKNLQFPSAQSWPHSSFGEEISYIKSHEKLQNRLCGSGHILGPITGDHWFVYVADHPLVKKLLPMPPLAPSFDRTINMMMFKMAPDVGKIFYQENTATAKEMTLKSGIHHLCPGAQIDETAFTPCGYSMNAILHNSYSTVHITPEPECSYVSFETNTPLDNYAPMVRNVLTVFRPQRFVLTMFGHESAFEVLKSLPTDSSSINLPSFGVYSRSSVSSTRVDLDLQCLMGCYTLDNSSVMPSVCSAQGMASLSSKLEKIAVADLSEKLNDGSKKERSYTFS